MGCERDLGREMRVLGLSVTSAATSQTRDLGIQAQNRDQTWEKTRDQTHSPNLPYSEGIGSPAAAIPILKVV